MKKLITLSTMALMLIFANIALAQPSKQETINYIMKKTKTCTDSIMNESNMFISEEEDLIVFDQITAYSAYRERMPLSSLTGAKVSVRTNHNDILRISSSSRNAIYEKYDISDISDSLQKLTSCQGLNCKQKISGILGKLKHRFTTDYFNMNSCSNENIKKLAKAFNHLAKLIKKDNKINEIF